MPLTQQLYQGAVGPIVAMTLVDQNDNPISLQNVVSLHFHMTDMREGSIQIDAAASKIQTDDQQETWGQVAYFFTADDTNRVGLYEAWFIVDMGVGPIRYPINDHFFIEILPAP